MTASLKIGDTLPKINFISTLRTDDSFENYHGKWLVLYFYPKDKTPGCTLEGQQFRDYINEFHKLNAIILGVSKDSQKSHDSFKCKQNFPFDLISDLNSELCNLFHVINEKSLYGKIFKGIERSTFLIDPNGVLKHEWRKVKVNGHVEAVLDRLKALCQKQPHK
jgi:peroxiredoxin Q/BCP